MTTVSQPGYFNLQSFDSLGALGVGMRLYTYAAGTTTHKTSYTDAAGAVAQTYTSDGGGGQYIAMNARGELPAPLYLTAGAYDLALKTSAGATVWTRRADPTGADLASSSGSSSVGFIQAGTGAVARTSQAKMRETVSITDFGASTSETAANNTAAINAAIVAGSSVYIPAGTYTCNAITIQSGMTLYGDGAASVLSFPAGQTGLYGLSASAGVYLEDVTIKSLKLLGAVGASAFSEQVHLANLNGVRNLIVKDVEFVGFQGDGLYIGAHTTNDRHNVNVKITNCLFDGVNKDNRNGVSCIDGDNVQISGCTFQNCTRSGMPGPIDFEPNNVANVIRKIRVSNNHFQNTDSIQSCVNFVITYTLTTEPHTFTVSNNTFDVTTRMITFRNNHQYTAKTNLVVSGNGGLVFSAGEYYSYIDGLSIIGNTLEQTGDTVIGFTNTDVISNVTISGNVFVGKGSSGRAFGLRCGSGHVVSGNVFSNFATYGFLCGITGGTLSNTTISGNTFTGIGTYAVGAVAGGVDGITCTFLGNTHNLTHQFPAWRNDDCGDITNGDTSPTTFNADTLPDSFTPEGVFRSVINGDTAVPSTGGYQGTLTCHCESGQQGRKFKYQVYYPSNNSVKPESFYTRKGSPSSNVWTAWKEHAGV
jgi:hypothetical protein